MGDVRNIALQNDELLRRRRLHKGSLARRAWWPRLSDCSGILAVVVISHQPCRREDSGEEGNEMAHFDAVLAGTPGYGSRA